MPFVPLLAAPAPAQIPAPEAAALRVDDRAAFALDAALAGFVCENGRARLRFGGFPPGKPVQAAVRDPQGRVLGPGPRFLAADGRARRAAAFRNGALAGNGRNRRNGNPETGNAAARRLECR